MNISLTLSAIGVILTLFGMFFSNLGCSDNVKLERYKEKGTDYKKKGQLSTAMKFYKRALNHAGDEKQKAKIWQLILFVQTDRALASHTQYYQNSGKKMTYTTTQGTEHYWFFNGTEPPDYNEPPREEILK